MYFKLREKRPEELFETELDELIFFHHSVELEFPPPKQINGRFYIKDEALNDTRDDTDDGDVQTTSLNADCSIPVEASLSDDNDILSGELPFQVIFVILIS